MKTYGQFCPVAMALEVLAERWTLLVVRELLCGSHRFNDIRRGVPLMSRTMLSQRLKSLEDAGIVVKTPRAAAGGGFEYSLTQAGQELEDIVVKLGFWGKRWVSHELKEEHLDPGLLMWDMQRRINQEAVPTGRIVVRFEFVDARPEHRRYWLRLEGGEADVCLTDPGHEVQLVVEAETRSLVEVWQGLSTMAQATRSHAVRISGDAALKRQLPLWLRLSTFAEDA
jgi:DNA-binding HxlR family transcriptional regulator